MSDLQLGLLVIGAAAVAGVLLYNRVQERSARRQGERAFGSQHSDVLLDAAQAKREPSLAPAARRAAALPAEALPDPRLDYVIALAVHRPVAAAQVLETWIPLERRFSQRALLAASDGTAWRRIAAGDTGTASALHASLQLVSRAGVASESDLIAFRSEVETLAAGLGATVSAPEMRQALEVARELDRFCAEADIQIAFHLVSGSGALVSEALHDATTGAGFEPAAPGRYALRDTEGRVLLDLAERDSRSVTLTLEVPRTAELGRTYESMVRCARQLGTALGAALVDDNGNALDDRALMAIAAQLETVRRAFHGRGFEPGGALALRLFS